MVQVQYQLTDDEGVFWYAAQHGLGVYKDINVEPYISINNPPVYSILVGVLIKVFGSSLIVGRVVSVLAFLATCGLIYSIVNLLTKDKLVSTISGLFPMAVWFFTYWSVTFRPDILGIPLSLLGVFLVLKYKGSRKLFWSIPLFLLAIFTKQIFVSAPMVVCIYLFLSNKKLGLAYLVCLGGLVGGVLGVLNLVTDGYFIRGIWEASFRPSSLIQLPVVLNYLLQGTSLVLIVLSFWYLIKQRKDLGLLGIYFLVSLVVFMYQVSNSPGAGWNYTLEFIAVSSILSGLLIYCLVLKSKTLRGLKVLTVTLVLLVLVGLFNFTHMGYKPNSSLVQDYPAVAKYLQGIPDPILADSTTLLMVNNRQLVWESTSLIQAGLVNRVWNQSPILEDIGAQRFSLVIMEFEISRDWTNSSRWEKSRLSPEIANRILDYYELTDTVGLYRIYIPKFKK
jgi:hypothetical protein